MSESKEDDVKDDVVLPKECKRLFQTADAAPPCSWIRYLMSTCVLLVTACHILINFMYSWLFAQVSAALHHGGAGTTGRKPARYGILSALNLLLEDDYN